jgi:phosphohistidine phosphatase
VKTLLLMRHAKSSWDDDGVSDHDRPLNTRGERSAPHMAELLLEAKLEPELILSSTALRARTTAFAVAERFGWQPEVRLRRGLYMAEPGRILAEIAGVPREVGCLLVVGHNPGMEDLVSDLGLMRQAMPTAAIARFHCQLETWGELGAKRGELAHVYRPKDAD